jgi:hypothetical protein
VRALTAAGRSASMPRRRLGTEITHCRTGTDGIRPNRGRTRWRSVACIAGSSIR